MKHKRLLGFALFGLMVFSFPAYLPKDNFMFDWALNANAATSADFSISQNGIEFICAREGFHATCYWDYSQSSIGYGTKCNGSSTQPHTSGSHTITKEQAMADMKDVINSTYAPRVRAQTTGIVMNQNQFDALVSLAYNCGGGNNRIYNCPLVKYLRGELTETQARSQYSEYIVYAGGNRLQGLVNRRNAEADLFFSTLPKLGSPMLSINRSTGTPNDTISITWDAVQYADSYWLHIYKDGEDYVNQTLNQALSYSASYPAGKYTAFVVSCNSQEEALSSVDFSIYDSVPEKPNPKISKESYSINETVDITWNTAENTDFYWLHIYRNGEDYVNQSINQDLSYSSQYPVGEYTAYIVSCNGIGETLSSVSFTVYDSAPNQPNPKISKKSYSINETVDITWDAAENTDFYWLHIYRNGEDYVNQSINQDLSYSSQYPVGEYTAYIVSCNGIGETLSSVSFAVIDKLNVTLDANGGSCSASSKDVTYSQMYGDLPTPTKNGYTFNGWYTAKDGGTKVTSDTIVTATENHTLYAHWEDKEAPIIQKIEVTDITLSGFKLTVSATDTAGIGSISADVSTWRGFETDGKKLTATKSGDNWIFDVKVSDFNTSYGAYYCTVAVTDVNGNTVKSDTKEIKVGVITCTFDANGGNVEQRDKVLVYGESYARNGELPIPTKAGYAFEGWYTDKTGGTKITNNTKLSVTTNQTLYAHWVRSIGDINSDGQQSVLDAVILQKYLLKRGSFTKEQFDGADINQDGKVNVFDLVLLKKRLLNGK